jgi:hypothetical protein
VSALALAMMIAPAAQASQILTAVESEQNGNGPSDTQVSGTAGTTLSTTYGGANTRALTDYGVNKIYASGTASYEQYATSAWLDSYTVQGTGNLTVSFTFSIDGAAGLKADSAASFNFNVYALRGDNWSMAGYGGSGGPSWYSPSALGGGNERPILTQTVAPSAGLPAGRVTQADMRDFEGFWNYANAGGQPGAFGSHVQYVEGSDYYSVQTANGSNIAETDFYATGFRNFLNGAPTTPFILYTTNAQTMQVRATRTGLDANYSLLDMAQLCVGDSCDAGTYPGTDLTLTFTLAAGSVFTLGSFLGADDLRDETVDFFHTAKMTGVTVSGGGTITSNSGTLNLKSDGSYGYAAVQALEVAAVPEPAAWAMMVGGFGFVGMALRRRGRGRALAA